MSPQTESEMPAHGAVSTGTKAAADPAAQPQPRPRHHIQDSSEATQKSLGIFERCLLIGIVGCNLVPLVWLYELQPRPHAPVLLLLDSFGESVNDTASVAHIYGTDSESTSVLAISDSAANGTLNSFEIAADGNMLRARREAQLREDGSRETPVDGEKLIDDDGILENVNNALLIEWNEIQILWV
jgi:hypothetical protein